jgi:type IV pilus assembly protein PilY1
MSKSNQKNRFHALCNRLLPGAIAFAATVLSLPIHAVSIPDNPLQSGAAYPPANVMLILDDSGSMADAFMPDNVPATSPTNIASQAYTRNTLSYNPNNKYEPWIRADGSRYPATPYTAVYSSTAQASGSTTDLSSGTQTFYVPKSGATDMAATGSYYRYQIVQGGGDVVKSEWGTVTSTWTTPTGLPGALGASSGGMANIFTFTLPADITELEVTLTGNNPSGDGADLYVRHGNWPTTSNYDCRSTNGSNNETCDGSDNDLSDPAAGNWYIGINRASNYSNVTLNVRYAKSNRCGTGSGSAGWINCSSETPTGRDVPSELANYATWYSYHRTRMKVAKAGASEAFSQLGSNLRVGYTNIHDEAADKFPIPVATNDGKFEGANRSTWFTKLQAQSANGYTPLRTGLAAVGEYYKSTSSTGPWATSAAEAAADQISCRQNFAILTTDGYWNTDDEGSKFRPTGNIDNTAGPNGYTAVAPYADNYSSTLADIASHYWKNDLRADLADNVAASASDSATWQHMVTFSISIGLGGTISTLPTTKAGWPDPISNSGAQRIDDLWHAAVNGHGSFVTATNGNAFAQALVDALSIIDARTGSASNVAANSTSLTTDTRVFQAKYTSGRWTGELEAYAASSAGVAANPEWRASQLIPTTGRKVFTWNGTTGIDFASLSGTKFTALDKSARALSPATAAQNRDYILGSTALETRNGVGKLRNRMTTIKVNGQDTNVPTVLGDIVNSSPVYVSQSQTIFVGANDGMLHAFDAVTGVERFAYVPGGIDYSLLANLSDPQYVHKYFVDGPIVVSTTKQTPGKNYLVGALGRGGRGLYALDVTSPSTFAASNAMWEFTDADMGNVTGEPLVVTMNDGSKAVIVSNGINSDPTVPANSKAVLYVIDVATGALLKKLDTGVSGDNGLSAPRGWDNDGNGTVDYVYAGDLKGNLWKFDLTAGTSGGWVIANSGSPIFVATDAANNRQPITAGLAIAREPITARRWIFIGTGSFMTTGDQSNRDVQSMYGVVDDGTSVVAGRTSSGDGDLMARSIVVTGTVGTPPKAVRAFEAPSPLTAGKKGWYIDLNNPSGQGERIVSRPQVRGTVLITASLVPGATNTCLASGSGYINALDAFTGASLSEPYFDSNSNGVFSDDTLTHDGSQVPVGSIDLGVGMPTLPTILDNLLVVGGSKGTLGSMLVNPQGGSPRRLSWREILKD